MPIAFAHILLAAATAYLGAGSIFATLNVVGGLRRLDSSADGARIGVRLLVAPGLILVWPLLLPRWIRGTGWRPVEVTAHRQAEART